MGRSIGKIRSQGFPAMEGGPAPIVPTENKGIMSGPIRKPRGDRRRRRRDERGSRRGFGRLMQVTKIDPKTGRRYGGLVKDGIPQFKKPDGTSPEIPVSRRPESLGAYNPVSGVRYTRSGIPTAVEQTRRVPVQDPTLGGPPEREVPLPKEKDMTPRGPAPFAPNEEDAAKQRFFETMFERAANRKERSGIDRAEMMDRQEARRDEAMMRDSEMGGRRRGRRDFTRRRPERRRSREERAAFRDRYVSTLGSNFFS